MEHTYTDKLVTPWGGMKEMKMLIDKTGISKKLGELGLPESRSNNRIDPVSIVESFLVSVWIGCFRFSHTAVVKVDEVLREMFGWKRVASGTTFDRFFKKFTPSMNHEIFIELYSWFFEQLKFDNYTLEARQGQSSSLVCFCERYTDGGQLLEPQWQYREQQQLHPFPGRDLCYPQKQNGRIV